MSCEFLIKKSSEGSIAATITSIFFPAVTMLLLAWLIKAPLFFLAVGSQANVGGAASAPRSLQLFHPALAPVGVLLAVLGYSLGTYGGWLSGQLMRVVAPE